MKNLLKIKSTQIRFKQIVLILFVLCSTTGIAQRKMNNNYFSYGLNLDRYVNGNGHGSYYNLSATASINKSTIAIGPSFQRSTKQVNGMRFSYSYSVTGLRGGGSAGKYLDQYDEREELSFFCSVQYYKNAGLSNGTLDCEGLLSNETLQYYQSLKFNTVESYAGMAFNFKIFSLIKLRSFIALGYYKHLNFQEPMTHDGSAVVLMTGIGIGLIK